MIQIPDKVKNLLRQDSVFKNFRVHFPNGERADITNANIVSESMSLTESLCSRNELKLGLCEMPSIEFETIGVEKIKGAEIECSLEVDVTSLGIDNNYIISPFNDSHDVDYEIVTTGDNQFSIFYAHASYGTPYVLKNLSELNLPLGDYLIEFNILNLPEYWTQNYFFRYMMNPFVHNGNGHENPFINGHYVWHNDGEDSHYIGLTFFGRFHPEPDEPIQSLNIGITMRKIDSIISYEPVEFPYADGSTHLNGNVKFTVLEAGKLKVEPHYAYDFRRYGAYHVYDEFWIAPDTSLVGLYKIPNTFVDTGYGHNQASITIQPYTDQTVYQFRPQDDYEYPRYVWLDDGCDLSFEIETEFSSVLDETEINLNDLLVKCTNYTFTPAVEGQVYKNDVGKWVYPIPLGKFVVDSCKKQADMTHRKIVAYAKSNWQFNRITRDMFNAGFYWARRVSDEFRGIAIEALIRLLYPETGTFELVPETDYIYFDNSVEVASDTSYSYSARYDYIDLHQMFYTRPFYNIKLEYDTQFQTLIEQYLEILQELSAYDIESYMNTFSAYSSPSADGGDYGLSMPSSMIESGRISTGMLTERSKTRFYCTPGLLLGTEVDNEEWTLRWSANAYFPTRVRLFKIDNTSYDEECIFDTGNHIPVMYKDVSLGQVSFVISPSNLYIPVTSKKQKVSMNKIPPITTVKRTLYKYDLSSLNSLNLQKVVESYCELTGKFGVIDREGNFKLMSINDAFTDPTIDLTKSDYKSLWYDDDMTKPYGRVQTIYNDVNGNKVFTSRDIVESYSPDIHKVYDLSENYFMQNSTFIEEAVQAILQVVGNNIKDISYMPMQLSIKGGPDIEVGDVVTVETDEEEPITSLVMQRNLTGIQGLIDDIDAKSEEDVTKQQGLEGLYDAETGILTITMK